MIVDSAVDISCSCDDNTAETLTERSTEFLQSELSEGMRSYESRPSQVAMLKACSQVIDDGGFLLAEAGTGTGKTFAYLIPIILSGKRAIVSTRTINLQEQMVSKDLEFLSKLEDFTYAMAKGRSNYLCLRRLSTFKPTTEVELTELTDLLSWSERSGSGDREELSKHHSIWDSVCSDPDTCKKRSCQSYDGCFYFDSRKRCEEAQVVVANHNLIAINAMLCEESKILPGAEVLVIDEAHALDHVISMQTGTNIASRDLSNILNRLLTGDGNGKYKGLLAGSPNLYSAVESLKAKSGLFWISLRRDFKNKESVVGSFILKDETMDISLSIKTLAEEIRETITESRDEVEETALLSYVRKLETYASEMADFCEHREESVRWVEIRDGNVSIRASLLYPGDFVTNRLLSDYKSVIMTSATLTVSGDFSFTEKLYSLKNTFKIRVPSSFDMCKQARIEVKKGINVDRRDGILSLGRLIIDESAKREGGVLALFTSQEVMKKTWFVAHGELEKIGIKPMMQGDLPNKLMIDAMRGSLCSVIFGLDSFWEGLDIQGDSLKCLIITKLPFEVPTDPLVKARTEEIARRGGNPFMEYALPKAIMKFKQGFGRLIRSKDDVGRVIICDERIESKPYGHLFLGSVLQG